MTNNKLNNPMPSRKTVLTQKTNAAAKSKLTPIEWIKKYAAYLILIGLITAALIAGIIGALFVQGRIEQNTIRDFGRTKVYATYTLEYGDTLWDIGDIMIDTNYEYPTIECYIRDVKSINQIIYEDSLKEGRTIILPYYVENDAVTIAASQYIANPIDLTR